MKVCQVVVVTIFSSSVWCNAMDPMQHKRNCCDSTTNQKIVSSPLNGQNNSSSEGFRICNGLDYDIWGIFVKYPYDKKDDILEAFYISKNAFVTKRPAYKDLGLILYLDKEYS